MGLFQCLEQLLSKYKKEKHGIRIQQKPLNIKQLMISPNIYISISISTRLKKPSSSSHFCFKTTELWILLAVPTDFGLKLVDQSTPHGSRSHHSNKSSICGPMQVREQVLDLVLKNVSQRSVTSVDQFGYLSAQT